MDNPITNEKWEYKVLTVDLEGWMSKKVPEGEVADLSALGEQGWEMVSAAPVTGSGSYMTSSLALFFKRRRAPE